MSGVLPHLMNVLLRIPDEPSSQISQWSKWSRMQGNPTVKVESCCTFETRAVRKEVRCASPVLADVSRSVTWRPVFWARRLLH